MTNKDTIGKTKSVSIGIDMNDVFRTNHNQTIIDEDAWFEEQFKKRWPMIDEKFLDEMQAVLDIGSETNGKGDWRERRILLDSEMQHAEAHLNAWWTTILDRDSRLPVTAHIACRAMIARYQERKGEK